MTVEGFAGIVALWAEYELGPARRVRPRGLGTRIETFGATLAAQGHRIVEARAGIGSVRADLRARYVSGGGVENARSLDLWEAAFDTDLRREPALLTPPGPVACEAEVVARIAGEVEGLLGGMR